jgi:dTDP-4-amino-4,6-dideoxygalactose transaminase
MHPDQRHVVFNDLRAPVRGMEDEIAGAVARVMERGRFLFGPEVEAFEGAFARYVGVAEAVGVANGTDALELALRAAEIGPGDEVITVSHTAVATICAIVRAGATPVLVDIERTTFTMDIAAAEAAIGPRTRAIVAVHLYGCPANLSALSALCSRLGLLLVEDCAQAVGAQWAGRAVGAWGDVAAFSFYPTKNLGAMGDAGAVVTGDSQLATRVRSLRFYGQAERDRSVEHGMNSRMDEIQAAILLTKLTHLEAWNQERRRLAADYSALLRGVEVPTAPTDARHVYHLYVVRSAVRDELRRALKVSGVQTLIHYPLPIHLQPAYESLGQGGGALPETESAAAEILSLPLYPGLQDEVVEFVCETVSVTAGRLG